MPDGTLTTDVPSPTTTNTVELQHLPPEFVLFLDHLIGQLKSLNGGWGGFGFDVHNGVPGLISESRTYKAKDWTKQQA